MDGYQISSRGIWYGMYLEMNAALRLQRSDHAQQMSRLGIAFWAEHTHQALGRRAGGVA